MPVFFLIIFSLSLFNGGLFLLILINCAFGWMGISQLIRTETLKARKESFIEAATAIGGSKLQIFLRHIVPNISLTVMTQLPFMFIANIGGLAVLDYLGMGVSNQYPSLGGLIAEGKDSNLYSMVDTIIPFPCFRRGAAAWVCWSESFRKAAIGEK